MPLTDTQLRNLKPEARTYRRADGGGLFIEVSPLGSKLWRLAYRYNGKQKLLALGTYPETPLARAREKRQEAKGLLQEGVDPGEKAKADREERRARAEDTFSALAEELMARGAREGRAAITIRKKRWLIGLAAADIGARPIREITAAEILKPLRRLEDKGHYESAIRMRAVVGQVFRYAIATGRAENDPTFGLRGAIITPKVSHRAAITEREAFLELVRHVWAYDGAAETRAALKLMVLLYPRPGELRLAWWKEFDLEKRTWTIPATRAKMRRQHVKPLPAAAVAILKDLQALNSNSLLVFPSQQAPGKPISENTMNLALRRMGYAQDEHTSHGFRASASSLLNESGKWHADAIEAELGHVGEDQVRKAYHRARYWEERVAMAEWWAGEVLGALPA
ncbi:MAG: tyrosine-type recombinase/integrase [Hyphomonas sp.]